MTLWLLGIPLAPVCNSTTKMSLNTEQAYSGYSADQNAESKAKLFALVGVRRRRCRFTGLNATVLTGNGQPVLLVGKPAGGPLEVPKSVPVWGVITSQ